MIQNDTEAIIAKIVIVAGRILNDTQFPTMKILFNLTVLSL